jgi:hypothetical protein
MGAYTQPAEYIPAMANPYGVVLDDESLRWAAAESVSEAVIAAICLLETRSVDEIVARLTTVELEQVIKIVGRCPRCYPPGAYHALKGHRRTPSPMPQPGINPGPERSHRSTEQTKPGIQHTHQRRMPPRQFAGFGANAPLSASQRATVNPYGITLDRPWTEWAAKQGVHETIAAALYLISENRKTDEIVIKLTPADIARVIDIVQRWPDCFPPGTLAALNHSRSAPPPDQRAARPAYGAGPTRPAGRINPGIRQLHPKGLCGPVPPSTARPSARPPKKPVRVPERVLKPRDGAWWLPTL